MIIVWWWSFMVWEGVQGPVSLTLLIAKRIHFSEKQQIYSLANQ